MGFGKHGRREGIGGIGASMRYDIGMGSGRLEGMESIGGIRGPMGWVVSGWRWMCGRNGKYRRHGHREVFEEQCNAGRGGFGLRWEIRELR